MGYVGRGLMCCRNGRIVRMHSGQFHLHLLLASWGFFYQLEPFLVCPPFVL